MYSEHDTEILIGKVISGNASEEEISQLEKWRQDSEANQRIFDQSMKIWRRTGAWIPNKTANEDKMKIQDQINAELMKELRKIRRRSLFYKVAAVLAIPITFSWSYYFVRSGFDSASAYCQVSAPKGQVATCILPDGSEVWINSGSAIRYHAKDFHHGKREIQLKGEAFFQVTKNKREPFKVITPLADIHVTGTSFNVKAIPGSNDFESVLTEGRIQLLLKEYSRERISLSPGERAKFDPVKKKLVLDKVDPDAFTCWRKGEIVFKNATLGDLIKKLQQIYDVEFVVADENLREYSFRGMFRYSNNLIEALEKIRKTADVDYRIENRKVTIKKSKK